MSILFKGNLEEGNYTLIKTTDGWVLKGKTSYVGFNFADRPQGEWIPCSERVPSNFNEDEAVLATTDVDGRRVMLMPAVDVERFYLKGYVSAWMPSPQPWEGADDE